MANKILSKLSNRPYSQNKDKSLASKVVSTILGISLLLIPPVGSGIGLYKLIQSKEPQKEAIKKVESNSPEILRNYLRNNPQLVKDFLINYEDRQFLQEMLFSEKISKGLMNVFGMLYEEDGGKIYFKERNGWRNVKEDISQMSICNDIAYFVENNQIFSKKDGEEIKKLTMKRKPKLHPIYGTNCCLVSSKEGIFLINEGPDKSEFEKISKSIKNFGFIKDFKNKIFYDEGRLYWDPNQYLIYSSKFHNISQLNARPNDYILYDVDNDKEKEFVVSISDDKKNYIQIYKRDKLILSIPCKKKVDDFDYSPQKRYSFLELNFENRVYDSLGIANFNSVKGGLESKLK